MTRLLALFLILITATAGLGAADTVAERLEELGIELPESSPPVANYVPSVRSGNLVFLAGAVPRNRDGSFTTGRLGEDYSVAQGAMAARQTGIALLAALKAEIGDLEKVVRVVKLEGFVNATPDFTQHPQVVNGCSDLMVEVFGEAGKHARIAVGMASLPFNVPVEISAIVEVRD